VPLISYSFWNLKSFDSKNYLEFKGQIEAESVSNRISEKNLEFTYKIKNSTKYKWDSIKYQMIGYDSLGKIVTTKNGGIYEWLIQPKSNALITLEIPNESNEEVKTWKFEIIDLRTSRF